MTVAALGSAVGAAAPDADGLQVAFVVAGVVGLVALVAASFVRARRTADEEITTESAA